MGKWTPLGWKLVLMIAISWTSRQDILDAKESF
jgi:hypothetical protein